MQKNLTSKWIVHKLDRDGDTYETLVFKTKKAAINWITKKGIVNVSIEAPERLQ